MLGLEGSPRQLAAEGRHATAALKVSLLVIFSALPLALALVGLAAARRAPAAGVCASVWLYTAAALLPVWAEYRYWVPATPFLLVGAVAGAYELWRRAGVRRAASRAAARR